MYSITAVQISDFKRIKDVQIIPGADRALVLISGKNAQGKSSVIDALTAVFGGARGLTGEHVRHGAKSAEIRVELDGGALVIRRVIEAGGKTFLEVRDPDGAIAAPQTVLDRLFGASMLDPLAFLALDGKKQRAKLMELIPNAARIDELDAKRERAFKRRTELNGALDQAKGEVERLGAVAVDASAELLDAAALAARQKAFSDDQRAGAGIEHQLAQAKAALATIDEKRVANQRHVRELEQQLQHARQETAALEQDREIKSVEVEACTSKLVTTAATWAATQAERDQLDRDLARAGAHNAKVFEARAHAKRKAEAEAEVTKLAADSKSTTEIIALIDERKAATLAAAKLPVEGLTVVADGILFNGVPFAQASAAERHRVAVALAIAARPDLADVWVRDGSLYDEDTLALVVAQVVAAGKCLWLEVVGTRIAGAIVIQDGQVVA